MHWGQNAGAGWCFPRKVKGSVVVNMCMRWLYMGPGVAAVTQGLLNFHVMAPRPPRARKTEMGDGEVYMRFGSSASSVYDNTTLCVLQSCDCWPITISTYQTRSAVVGRFSFELLLTYPVKMDRDRRYVFVLSRQQCCLNYYGGLLHSACNILSNNYAHRPREYPACT